MDGFESGMEQEVEGMRELCRRSRWGDSKWVWRGVEDCTGEVP